MWTDLKAAIDAVINTNGTQSITGEILRQTLNSIVDNVGENATFKGVAIPSDNPGTPDGNVFYLAVKKGVYPNFNALSVHDQPGFLIWDGEWSFSGIGSASFDVSANISRDLAEFMNLSVLKNTRFTKSDLHLAGAINTTGGFVGSSVFISSGYIDLQEANVISITVPVNESDVAACFYGDDYSFLSNVYEPGEKASVFKNVEIPVDAKYIRLTYWAETYNDTGFEFMAVLQDVDPININSLRANLALFTGQNGYVKMKGCDLEFSELYILDRGTGKRCYLTDGVNDYDVLNSITLSDFDAIYIDYKDFLDSAPEGVVSLKNKIWTSLDATNKSVGIAMDCDSLGNSDYHGEIFEIVKTSTLDKVSLALKDNHIEEDSRLDHNTTTDGSSAGDFDIRFPNANNYIQKLGSGESTYFKVSLNTDGGVNPAIWMLDKLPESLRSQNCLLSFEAKSDIADTLLLNTDGVTQDVQLTTDWNAYNINTTFGEVYGDMRLMLYKNANIIFYIKNISLYAGINANIKSLDIRMTDVEGAIDDTLRSSDLNLDAVPALSVRLGELESQGIGVVNVGLFGDSWTHGVGTYSVGLIAYAKYLVRLLQERYGYAGLGWFDFGQASATDMGCADDEAVTFTKSGGFTYKNHTSDCLGITISHTLMEVSSWYDLTFDQGKDVDSAKIWYYNDAHFEYSVGGASATEVTADGITGWQSVTIVGAIPSLKITALSNDCIIFGVDLSYGDTGVKVHKIGCRGLNSAQAVSVDANNWIQGLQSLNLDFFSSLLFTNDRTLGFTPSSVVANTEEIFSRVNSAYPNKLDFAIICPSETPGGTGAYPVGEYTSSLFDYAAEQNIPFVSLVPIFGTIAQINELGTFYDTVHPNTTGMYMIGRHLNKKLFLF